MAISISNLDRFKIETKFGDGFVVQKTYEWELSARRQTESKWADVKKIGSGASGSVWLEKEESRDELRAVKRMERHDLDPKKFNQELLVMVMLADVRVPGELPMLPVINAGYPA